jgi:hypothetical protein
MAVPLRRTERSLPMPAVRPVFLALLASILLASGPASAARVLAPHRAVYDLDLAKANEETGISGLSGRMVYEFDGSPCDGYTVTFRFVTQFHNGDASQVTDQQTTTYEDGEGKSFSFATRSFVDQSLEKEVKGKATIEDGNTTVDLEKPEKSEIQIGKALFPTQHLIELLERAESGETFYETTLFDGSEDGDRAMTTTVIVGKRSHAQANDPERAALDELESESFWPVNIAYFDPKNEGGEEVPTYQISFKLYANGVTRDLVMDYGEFTMEGRLVDLSLLETAEDCPRQ